MVDEREIVSAVVAYEKLATQVENGSNKIHRVIT